MTTELVLDPDVLGGRACGVGPVGQGQGLWGQGLWGQGRGAGPVGQGPEGRAVVFLWWRGEGNTWDTHVQRSTHTTPLHTCGSI